MGWRAVAPRAKIDRARLGFGEGNKLGNRLGGDRWVDHHDGGLAAYARDRRDVADEIEIEVVIERRVDRVRRIGEQQRIAVRRRAHARLGANVAAGAGPVLDDKLLTEPFGQPLRHRACGGIGRAARWKTDYDTHRPHRIIFRPCEARDEWESGSTRS